MQKACRQAVPCHRYCQSLNAGFQLKWEEDVLGAIAFILFFQKICYYLKIMFHIFQAI